jgi:hypothetical protein
MKTFAFYSFIVLVIISPIFLNSCCSIPTYDTLDYSQKQKLDGTIQTVENAINPIFPIGGLLISLGYGIYQSITKKQVTTTLNDVTETIENSQTIQDVKKNCSKMKNPILENSVKRLQRNGKKNYVSLSNCQDCKASISLDSTKANDSVRKEINQNSQSKES